MRELIFNLVNGVRSGIPLCCNLFFSHNALTPGPVAKRVYEKRTSKEFDIFEISESDYVQCNHCYSKNKVKDIRSNGVILRWLIGR